VSTLTAEDIRHVEHDATVTDVASIAEYLQRTLGQRLAAYLAGVNDSRMVGRWIRGVHEPRGPATMRLRAAYQVTRLVADAYDAETAKAWLLGSNSRLDGDAPAYLIRHADSQEDLRMVVPTARTFVGGLD
jgi:hypothetical protein